jgi:hypothetical protein
MCHWGPSFSARSHGRLAWQQRPVCMAAASGLHRRCPALQLRRRFDVLYTLADKNYILVLVRVRSQQDDVFCDERRVLGTLGFEPCAPAAASACATLKARVCSAGCAWAQVWSELRELDFAANGVEGCAGRGGFRSCHGGCVQRLSRRATRRRLGERAGGTDWAELD